MPRTTEPAGSDLLRIDDELSDEERLVRDTVRKFTADRIMPMKKPDMADAAEQLVAATGWLPTLLRTPEPVLADMVETDGSEPLEQPSEAQAPDTETEDGEVHYAVAAE